MPRSSRARPARGAALPQGETSSSDEGARLPRIIQGGMGAGVSGWRLARAVSLTGQLGVVAGTALDVLLARRLQLGDAGGHLRRALAALPIPRLAERVLERWFVSGGKPPDAPFAPLPPPGLPLSREREELLVAGNFVEVHLAREGHDGPVGINFLEKIQLPTLPSLHGAMLAGVGYVLMGAGIPRAIPGVLDRLAAGQSVELGLDVHGATRKVTMRFDPAEYAPRGAAPLERPRFLAIVSAAPIATILCRRPTGRIDGLVIEGPSAGGHNAPPRGEPKLDERGQLVYGERDRADLAAIAALGLPFWLAGSYGSRAGLCAALELGAAGVQVGTAFAFCEESGLTRELKARVLALSRAGEARTFSDPLASPTGFPFKVVELAGSLSEDELASSRARVCDLGFLRHAYEDPAGEVGWRCPGEARASYLRKGGQAAQQVGKKCVCNGLVANIGLAQRRAGVPELPLLTAGSDVATVARFLPADAESYTARDVIRELLG